MGFVLFVGDCGISSLPFDIPAVTAERVRLVDCPECVVTLGAGAELPEVRRAAGVLINGDCCGELPVERLNGVQLITCGRGGKNTVCLTSDSGDRVTAALNRAVMSVNGVCEPLEYPMERLPGTSEYGCMAAFAAAVLLGKIT